MKMTPLQPEAEEAIPDRPIKVVVCAAKLTDDGLVASVQVYNMDRPKDKRCVNDATVDLAKIFSRKHYARDTAKRDSIVEPTALEEVLTLLLSKVRAHLQERQEATQEEPAAQGQGAATQIVNLAREHLAWATDQYGQVHAEWDHSGALALARGVVTRKLARLYFDATGDAASREAIAQAKLTLAALADQDVTLALRVAQPAPDRVLIDRRDGSVVAISPEGWCIEPLPAMTFRRFDVQAPLSLPDVTGTPADLMALLELLRISTGDRLVLACWLVCAQIPRIAHAIVAAHGPKGAAKSTLPRLLRLLCDPLRDGLHTAPRDSRTLGITAEKRWLLTFDNMGEMPEWLSNLLCLTSTGGTMPLREWPAHSSISYSLVTTVHV